MDKHSDDGLIEASVSSKEKKDREKARLSGLKIEVRKNPPGRELNLRPSRLKDVLSVFFIFLFFFNPSLANSIG